MIPRKEEHGGDLLAFCREGTGKQIRLSIAEAHALGLRAPSPEERERLRLDAAIHLSAHGDERQRLLAIAYMGKVATGRV